MKILSKVVCRQGEYQKKEHGYSETRTVFTQTFILRRKWWFIPLPSKVLFSEEIPIWVKATVECFGHTDWRSAAPQWMHDAVKDEEWGDKIGSTAAAIKPKC